jgi:alcohol dehydrogenase
MSQVEGFVIVQGPTTHFGVGAIKELPAIVRGTGADAVVLVTDEALAVTPVIATVTGILADAAIAAHVFSGVHPSPTAGDLAAGAEAVAEAAADAEAVAEAAVVAATLKASAPIAAAAPSAPPAPSASPTSFASVTSFASYGSFIASASLAPSAPTARIALVAVGGGSAFDAAQGIALAAVNPEGGRDLGHRGDVVAVALPIVAVPTTFYVGHASSMPAAAILDPALTGGLSPAATAAAGLDALTHALESYLSLHPNPWSDGIALQVIRMIATNLPRACEDGTDLTARSQLLLAAHMAGVAMANTGLGLCHAIGHSLGGRWDIAHGVALSMLLPAVLRFNLPVRAQRMADIAFALGAGDTHGTEDRNAAAAIDAVVALRDRVGLTAAIGDFGITEADFAQIAADALDDGELRDTPRAPTQADISDLLQASL